MRIWAERTGSALARSGACWSPAAFLRLISAATLPKPRQFSCCRSWRVHENPLGLPRRAGPGTTQRKRKINGVSQVVLVSSGKGGVGKSTVAVNLALSLLSRGHSVGILDADIFGPSLPTMLALDSEPRITKQGQLVPLVNYGLKAMSMGFLVSKDKAVAWRGLLIQKALQQLLFEVDWGHLDYLVVDMPPGTGDVQLSIGQLVAVDGAVIVSTPQDVALADVTRGVDVFNSLKIPILGLVQNMSVFVCPNCSHETHIFGFDGALKKAQDLGINVLGNVPLSADIATASDAGKPIVLSGETAAAKAYLDAAVAVERALQAR